MKQKITKILALIAVTISLILPISAKAADAGDPAITDFVVYPAEPAPKSEVDFLVTFNNFGTTASKNVTLTVDYDENIFKRVVVGDLQRCENTGVTVVCNIQNLEPGSEDIIGFTAFIADNAVLGTNTTSQVSIMETDNPNDVTQNNFKSYTVKIGNMVKSDQTEEISTPVSEIVKDQKTLAEPSGKQNVTVMDVSKNPNWETSGLFTAGLKFLIRGKEALAWTMGIRDSGYHNTAIQATYTKVLSVVNSFFIIGLLLIAAMWMFSILIPRKYLRQVILVYGMAVMFVNFALPLNQLLIDGTSLLQKTFMSDFNITSIVQTPSYDDKNAVVYENKSGVIKTQNDKNYSLSLKNEGSEGQMETKIASIKQDLNTPSYIGSVTTKDGEQTVQLHSTSEPAISLENNQNLTISGENTFNPDQENSFFAFLMLVFTGLAYFLMAMLFVMRIVILWGLMIISPVLFLLVIFKFTRNYFLGWLSIYAKWLLIGPLMALGISLVVSIWKATGLPIQSSYTGAGEFGTLQNVGFYLPGSISINTLSNTQQMMEYMVFLIMLYFPIIFAILLTRNKAISYAANMAFDRHEDRHEKAISASNTQNIQAEKPSMKPEALSLMSGLKGFFNSSVTKFTKSPVSDMLKSEMPMGKIESASSFLPQQLALAGMNEMLEMTSGKPKGARNAHEKAIEILASADTISDVTEKQKVEAVRQEINNRAAKGDPEAVIVMDEVHEMESRTIVEPLRVEQVVEPIVEPIVEPVVVPVVVPVESQDIKQMDEKTIDKTKETEQAVMPDEPEDKNTETDEQGLEEERNSRKKHKKGLRTRD